MAEMIVQEHFIYLLILNLLRKNFLTLCTWSGGWEFLLKSQLELKKTLSKKSTDCQQR